VYVFVIFRIEWDAYDYHSGIDSLYWKLYDSVTVQESGCEELGTSNGCEDLVAQGNTSVSLSLSRY